MGASVKDNGGTDWILQLSRLRKGSKELCEQALKKGAGVLADGFRSEIENLPVDDRVVRNGEVKNGIMQIQKDGLLNSFGISPVDVRDGVYDVHLGWEGYNGISTNRWPQGQPNAMIARSINSGTSFMRATPFINRAKSKYQRKAEEAMEETIADEIGKIID